MKICLYFYLPSFHIMAIDTNAQNAANIAEPTKISTTGQNDNGKNN